MPDPSQADDSHYIARNASTVSAADFISLSFDGQHFLERWFQQTLKQWHSLIHFRRNLALSKQHLKNLETRLEAMEDYIENPYPKATGRNLDLFR